uniref:Uncharacterized protein n=1 Tax=Globodera rostochiensis TaxID=31243 RepID=A0A914GP91_GLORO
MSDNESDEEQQQQNVMPGDLLGPLHIRRMSSSAQHCRFRKDKISYIDRSVIEFLQSIRRLFSSGTSVCISTFANQNRSWEIIWHQIWPFFNNNICCLVFDKFRLFQLDAFRQFSPGILRNCANLRSLSGYNLFPEFPADDNANASSAQAVAKWLITPLHDGRPKILQCEEYTRRAMYSLQRAFRYASEPAFFILQLNWFVVRLSEKRRNGPSGRRRRRSRFYNAKVEIDLMDATIDDVNPPIFCSIA